MLSNLLKKASLTTLFLLFLVYAGYAQLPNYVSNYDCDHNLVSQTMCMDADSNGVFDTYGLQYCGQDTIATYAIKAIGDIRKWPPIYRPTRSVVFDGTNATSDAFIESFFDANGDIEAWFQKFTGVDTVFFHDLSDTYNPPNFAFDSSDYYIQTYPNPCGGLMNIHYVSQSNGVVSLQFLSYEGTILQNILRSPSGQGEYNLVFDAHNYSDGYYWIRYITANRKTYTISVGIIR
jgi:hypothetical protein